MTTTTALEYTPLPDRVRKALAEEQPDRAAIMQYVLQFESVQPRPSDQDRDVEVLDGVEMTHRFVEAPGDSETLRWHLVEAGSGEPIVFLHGLPESWFMWHRQMAALAPTHRVIAPDLKGYGQSDKRTGDYRQEGVAGQLLALLDALGLDRFNVVAHDRGSVIADYLGANHPERVLRYIRGEQHLYDFNPDLAPQERWFTDPQQAVMLGQPNRIVPAAYMGLSTRPIERDDVLRSIQEFSYPQIGWAVPRYFNSSSFRKEWIDRRTRLMAAWDFPVLVLQGAHDPRQPREFYENIERHMPDARVEFIDAGHFYVFENPDETTAAIKRFIEVPSR